MPREPSRLTYERCGSGEPLVLVHGLGGSRHVWDPVLDRLARDRDVIAVDLPGFGGSPPLSAEIEPTPAALGEAVSAFVASLGVGVPDLGGNSLGAWVALEMAVRGGARTVTAIAPAGLWGRPLEPRGALNARSIGRVLRPLIAPAMAIPAVRRAALIGTVGQPAKLTATQARRFIRDYVTAPGFVAVNRAMRASYFSRAAEVDVPVTIAWCERDRVVARRDVPELHAREVVLRGCGHIPMTDDPEAVAALLLAGAGVPSAAADR